MSEPDFEALRAMRNAASEALAESMRAGGWEVGDCFLRHKDACYCDCGNGGPCEHDWNGPTVDMGEGAYSVTCTRCGLDAMGHSLRNCP